MISFKFLLKHINAENTDLHNLNRVLFFYGKVDICMELLIYSVFKYRLQYVVD